MSSESDGDEDGSKKSPVDLKKRRLDTIKSNDVDKYKPYSKPDYKRSYPDNSNKEEFPVYVQGIKPEDKIGNKNPLQLSKIFKNVKGIKECRRINAAKIMLVFKQAAAANDFLSHVSLRDNNMKAFVPASSVERVGKIRFIPKECSNADLYHKLMADSEIVGVRRFMKRTGDGLEPLTTISVTFVGTVLPQYVYLDNWRYRVFTYIPPLMQCFKCMGFRHSAKVCRNDQVCSKCSGGHSYKECSAEFLKCVNCGGDHLAVSRFCPQKAAQIKKHENNYSSKMYSTVLLSSDFPPLLPNDKSVVKLAHNKLAPSTVQPKKQKLSQNSSHSSTAVQSAPSNIGSYDQLIKDDQFLSKIIKTLVMLGNSNTANTTAHIKEILIQNLTK